MLVVAKYDNCDHAQLRCRPGDHVTDIRLSARGSVPPRPTAVKAALAIMVATLVVALIRSLAWPVANPYAEWGFVVPIAVSGAICGGIILAVALRQRWAAIVYSILVVIGALFILLVTVPGTSTTRPLFDWTVLAAEVAAACLLFSRSARDWFAAGRLGKRFPPLWHPDPTGRHQYRYWDGTSWTAYVSDDGGQSLDPLPPIASA